MNKSLIEHQLNEKMQALSPLRQVTLPPTGWIKAIRLALNMSLLQLGRKLKNTKQNVHALELREKDGSISLKLLREVAEALDMQLVYGFVPNDGSLDALIDKKAKELATRIVLRSSNTMKLEDQENSKQRIEKAIEERAEIIKKGDLGILWD
jgi:predicted DNA-binding mobile mystery protein A